MEHRTLVSLLLIITANSVKTGTPSSQLGCEPAHLRMLPHTPDISLLEIAEADVKGSYQFALITMQPNDP